jgi:phage shock protein PspC (stress-responsive transcriptional regulator)
MKKTLSINLGGIVFSIDEDAYQTLNRYLNKIKGYFSASDGRDEIMTDIESRIAEMLQDKLGKTREVVTNNDIDEVIATMGQPEDFIDPEEQAQEELHGQSQTRKTKKRLFRDPDSRVIGGVCAGISHYFGISPIWLRLILGLAFVIYGFGLLLYILLWIIIPKARTSAEKLEMKGEPVNFNTIGKEVEEGFQNVNEKFNSFRDSASEKDFGGKVGQFFENLGQFLIRIFKLFFNALGKVLGVLLLIGGSVGLFAFIMGILGANFSPIMFGDADEFSTIAGSELRSLLFSNGFDYFSAITGTILVAGIPILVLTMVGWILLTRRSIKKEVAWGSLGAFILGMLLTIYAGLSTGGDFRSHAEVTEDFTISQNVGDTLILALTDNQLKSKVNINTGSISSNYPFNLDDHHVYLGDIDLHVHRSSDSVFRVEFIKASNGGTIEEAQKRAGEINYEYYQNGSGLFLSEMLRFPRDDQWRKQQVDIELYIPKGKTIYFENGLRSLLDDIPNVSNTYDDKMIGHYWTMTDKGLWSRNFEKEKKVESSSPDLQDADSTNPKSDKEEVSMKFTSLHFPNLFDLI